MHERKWSRDNQKRMTPNECEIGRRSEWDYRGDLGRKKENERFPTFTPRDQKWHVTEESKTREEKSAFLGFSYPPWKILRHFWLLSLIGSLNKYVYAFGSSVSWPIFSGRARARRSKWAIKHNLDTWIDWSWTAVEEPRDEWNLSIIARDLSFGSQTESDRPSWTRPFAP